MDNQASTDLSSRLQKAYKQLSDGQPQLALGALKEMQLAWNDNKDIQHLIALSYKALGDVDQSRSYFLKSLKLEQNQPEVHNNLANLLKSQGEYVDAQKHYSQALLLHPSYLQAQRNLAICYQAQANYPKALAEYRKALTLAPEDVSAINGEADCLRLMSDYTAAYQAYQKALAIDPVRLKSWHNLGLNFHLQGMLDEAIECYRKANTIEPNVPEVVESLALSLYESGALLEAIQLFSDALVVRPDNVQLHERFNSMLWETEHADRFGESYSLALSRLADSGAVSLSYASMLFKAGRTEQAKQVLDTYRQSGDEQTQALSLRGQIDADLGYYDSAYAAFAESLHHKFSAEVAQQMVKIDIILERYDQAQALLAKLFSDSSECQFNWALQGLVWRFCNDQRYVWLCDYQEFIQTFQLEFPKEHSSLESFLNAIGEELRLLHRNQHAPLQQTLRTGTQTAARLLHNPSPVLQQLKQSLTLIVARYIESLPDDATHPFLRRKSTEFEFAGSWSVSLRTNGFHVNHVHPEGWISSSCYISIPKSMTFSDDLRAGHIKFGESPLNLGDREKIELSLRPEPGMVVLFPSYFWHGTFPFTGGDSDVRLTAPFDVTPL